MNRVVKCKNVKCGQHFMHTKENTKCPFCHTEYGEVEEKEIKEKEGATSTQKGAFKIKIVKKNQDEK